MDAALLHTNDMLVRDPTFYQGICSAFPGRFYAMAPSNEALITTDSAAAVEGIRRGITTCGLHAIKFHINTWYNHTDERWDDNDSIRPYWEAATSLGVPVFFTPVRQPSHAASLQPLVPLRSERLRSVFAVAGARADRRAGAWLRLLEHVPGICVVGCGGGQRDEDGDAAGIHR